MQATIPGNTEPPFLPIFEALKIAGAPVGTSVPFEPEGHARELLVDRLVLAHRAGTMSTFCEGLLLASDHVTEYYARLDRLTAGAAR